MDSNEIARILEELHDTGSAASRDLHETLRRLCAALLPQVASRPPAWQSPSADAPSGPEATDGSA